MAILENSKRRIPQATYARVDFRSSGRPFVPRQPLVKLGLLDAGKVTAAEIRDVRALLQSATGEPRPAIGEVEALATLERLITLGARLSETDRLAAMAELDADVLATLAERLVDLREQRAQVAIASHRALLRKYRSDQPKPPQGTPVLPVGFEPAVAGPTLPANAQLIRRSTVQRPAARPVTTPARPPSASSPSRGRIADGEQRTVETMMLRTAPTALSVRVDEPTLKDLADWAGADSDDAREIERLTAAVRGFGYAADKLSPAAFEAAVLGQVSHSRNVLHAFRRQVAVNPVGFLHLERLTFAPDGIERGELVYTVPLTPGEEVNITHKEWSNTHEEFQKIVTDSLEEYSEEGVTESTELSQSTSNQRDHSNGLNTGVTTSGEYGPVSVSASVDVSIASSASSTQEFSRNQSIAVTRKAAARSKKEHKFSFKVASASGVEDQSVRRIRNPLTDRSARADYYQLVRKWEVKVYRYGIRLTYDIAIPEPGVDVLTKIQQIADLNAALEQGFGSTETSLSWARFDLDPSAISRDNYLGYAAQYNASVPAPPAERRDYDVVATHDWKTIEEAEQRQYHSLAVDVDADYEIDFVVVNSEQSHYEDEPWEFQIQNADDFFGVSGRRELVYQTKFLGAAYVELRVGAHLRDSVFKEWQLKAYAAMRDAAQARYYEQRVTLKDKLAKLNEELGASDALSLRKFEREEIMKGVLRWLFGPDFEFVPKGMSADLYDGGEAVKTGKIWKEVLRHGELIKFLHHAIEWENVLYFLYPYFWSHFDRWELKKYLQHPDPIHRAFLRAGSARVVLTIRPGFERSFLSLIETGSMGGLPANHPYLTIVEEMEAFASTNYPGIPPANPEGANTNEQGVLIGTWHEYTPTSSLDVAFGETLPLS